MPPKVAFDGPYNNSTPVEIGTPEVERPFAALGDLATYVRTRRFKQVPANFTPGTMGAADPQDASSYLIAESIPTGTETGLYDFTRTFATVPPELVDYSTITVDKPDPSLSEYPGIFAGVLVDKDGDTFDIFSVKEVSNDTGLSGGFYPTGGNYTLTFGANTTSSLSYNANAAAVEAALDALASVTAFGGCTVTGSYDSEDGFTVVIGSQAGPTLTTSSITGTGAATSSSVAYDPDGGPVTISISRTGGQVAGGSFDLTLSGDTASGIAYNATAATVQTALNALTYISNRGGCTVTLPPGQTTIRNSAGYILFYYEINHPTISGTSSLTPTSTIEVDRPDDTWTHQIHLAAGSVGRVITTRTAHGIANGDTIFLKHDGTYYFGVTDFEVVSTTKIRLLVGPSDPWAGSGAITELGKLQLEGYTPGPARVGCRLVSNFYLPGVTPGIADPSDIPIPNAAGDVGIFSALVAGSTAEVAYEINEFTRWRGGPIWQVTVAYVDPTTL